MCFQHEQHQKNLEARFREGSLESLNSFSSRNESSEDLAYRESYNKVTSHLAPWDSQMFKCVVRQSKLIDQSLPEIEKSPVKPP